MPRRFVNLDLPGDVSPMTLDEFIDRLSLRDYIGMCLASDFDISELCSETVLCLAGLVDQFIDPCVVNNRMAIGYLLLHFLWEFEHGGFSPDAGGDHDDKFSSVSWDKVSVNLRDSSSGSGWSNNFQSSLRNNRFGKLYLMLLQSCLPPGVGCVCVIRGATTPVGFI